MLIYSAFCGSIIPCNGVFFLKLMYKRIKKNLLSIFDNLSKVNSNIENKLEDSWFRSGAKLLFKDKLVLAQSFYEHTPLTRKTNSCPLEQNNNFDQYLEYQVTPALLAFSSSLIVFSFIPTPLSPFLLTHSLQLIGGSFLVQILKDVANKDPVARKFYQGKYSAYAATIVATLSSPLLILGIVSVSVLEQGVVFLKKSLSNLFGVSKTDKDTQDNEKISAKIEKQKTFPKLKELRRKIPRVDDLRKKLPTFEGMKCKVKSISLKKYSKNIFFSEEIVKENNFQNSTGTNSRSPSSLSEQSKCESVKSAARKLKKRNYELMKGLRDSFFRKNNRNAAKSSQKEKRTYF